MSDLHGMLDCTCIWPPLMPLCVAHKRHIPTHAARQSAHTACGLPRASTGLQLPLPWSLHSGCVRSPYLSVQWRRPAARMQPTLPHMPTAAHYLQHIHGPASFEQRSRGDATNQQRPPPQASVQGICAVAKVAAVHTHPHIRHVWVPCAAGGNSNSTQVQLEFWVQMNSTAQ